MDKIEHDRVEELREVFNLVDTDRSGTISISEFENLLDLSHVNLSHAEVSKMMHEINAQAEVTFDEFVVLMSTTNVSMEHTPEQVLAAMKQVGTHPGVPNGYIHATDLLDALTKYGSDCYSLTDAQKILSKLTCDANGYVCYTDLVAQVSWL